MVWNVVNFNCGEFLPGKEPISGGGIKPPTPPTYIPIHTSAPTHPPYVPGRPEEWVCICDAPCDSSIGFPNAGKNLCLNPASRRCVEKWTVPASKPMTAIPYTSKAACLSDAFNHEPCLICGIKCKTDSITQCIAPFVGTQIRRHCEVCPPAAIQPAECFYTSMQHCNTNCRNQDCIRQTQPGQPQQPPITPGGGTGTPANPVTFQTKYKCQELTIYCPGDEVLPVNQRRVKQIIRNCVLCSPNANGSWPTGCIYDTREACTPQCYNSEESLCTQGTQTTPAGQVRGENGITIVSTPSITVLPRVTTDVININQIATTSVNSYNEDPINTTNQIYHPTYNFFNNNVNQTANPGTVLVQNFNNLNVFSTQTTPEVLYFLDRIQSNTSWSEHPLFNLNTEGLGKSLNNNLNEAFSKIHNIGSQYVNKEYFYKMVLKLLVTGRIDELDPAYYISLAKRQSNDTFIKFEGTSVKEYLERASLGLISAGAVNSDPFSTTGYKGNQLKRQRRLNTDIEAYIEAIEIETPTTIEELDITDAGLEVLELSALNPAYIDLGDGAGYYVSSMVIEGTELPLEFVTQVSATYYVPPDVRYNALDIMGVNPGISLQASSVSGYGEFTSGFNFTSIDGPIYFKVDLSTIETGVRDNPLVDVIKAKFVKVTNPDEFRLHSINYGLSISKVNVDYRDPFYIYAKDTGIMDFTQNDITFRSFSLNRTSVGQSILARNIPFGLVLTPGCGSNHNPLGGESELVEFESDVVVRRLDLIPDINTNESNLTSPLLEEKILFNETSQYKIGLVETNNAQNVIYLYSSSMDVFNKSYYTSGGYSVNPPNEIERHPLSKFVVSTLDNVINTYDPTELTWWDLIRRLPLNQYAAIGYTSKTIFNKIEQGWRSSVPVRNVLSRLDKTYTGLLNQDTNDDNIIINESDRARAKIY